MKDPEVVELTCDSVVSTMISTLEKADMRTQVYTYSSNDSCNIRSWSSLPVVLIPVGT